MKRFTIIAASAAVAAAAGMSVAVLPPLAAQTTQPSAARGQTATFAIQNMTCATCPITVKKAIQAVPGVRSVSVDFGKKTAKVTFDPKRASLSAIAAASTNAGYPAKPLG